MKPRVNLAVPNYGSQMRSNFVHSLYPLLNGPLAGRCDFAFSEIDHADIAVARNYLISHFYYNKTDCTHLLMVDTDMGFGADLLVDMLALDRPVVGVLYPRRTIDLRRLHRMAGLPFEVAYARSLDFIGMVRTPNEVDGAFVRMESCGAGILLISRACVDTMVATMPDVVDAAAFRSHAFADRLSRFLTVFDPLRTADAHYSEDIAFCRRWVERCGGEIWASFRHRVSHVGMLTVAAAFADRDPSAFA